MGTAVNAERLGGLSETPLSAAMLLAPVTKPDFDGHITYSQTEDEDTVDQTGGWDVTVYASGIRSGFGAVPHTNGRLYATGTSCCWSRRGRTMATPTATGRGPTPASATTGGPTRPPLPTTPPPCCPLRRAPTRA